MGYLLDKLTEKPASKASPVSAPTSPFRKPLPSVAMSGSPSFSDQRDALRDVGRTLAPSAGAAGKWLGEKSPPMSPVSAGKNDFGDELVTSGWSDPHALRESLRPARNNHLDAGEKVSRPLGLVPTTAPLERLSRIFVGSGETGLTPDEEAAMEADAKTKGFTRQVATDMHRAEEGVGGVATALQMVADANQRLSNVRRWWNDDPLKKGDEPTYKYTPPGTTEQFEGPGPGAPGEVQDYWTLKDGSVVSTADINAAVKNEVKDFAGNVVGYRLPKGKDGSEGKVVPYEYIEMGAPQFLHSAFPDGTRFSMADGSIPPELNNTLKRQANTNPWLLGMDISDPRPPWMSAAGDSIFEKTFWDRVTADDRPVNNPWDFAVNAADNVNDTWREQSTVNEVLPFATDVLLSSAPYLFSPGYALTSAAAAAAPYALGYDADSAQPTGRGFENLDQLGNTKYIKTDLSNAQRSAGFAEPFLAAWLERFTGDKIGGLENLFPKGSKARKFFGKTGGGKALGGAIVEGPMEEAPLVPLQMIEQDDIPNYGLKQLGVNDKTGQMEYDQNSSPFWNTVGNMGNAAGAGGIMGGIFSTKASLQTDLQNRRDRTRKTKSPDSPSTIPVNPKRTQAQLEAERLGTLERNYGEGEAQ
jgi:hypothetical protein